MRPKGGAKKVTIYLNQDTRARVESLWSAVLNFLRSRHVGDATPFWADMGFPELQRMIPSGVIAVSDVQMTVISKGVPVSV